MLDSEIATFKRVVENETKRIKKAESMRRKRAEEK